MIWQYEIVRQKAFNLKRHFKNVHSGIRGEVRILFESITTRMI